MPSASIELPEDLDALRALARRQQTELDARSRQLAEQTEQIRWLEEYVRLLRHQRFGRRSEQGEESDAQARLFDEAEAGCEEQGCAEARERETIEVAGHVRSPRGRIATSNAYRRFGYTLPPARLGLSEPQVNLFEG